MRDCSLLREEYRQLSADWRMRDDYIQTKFIRSAFVYSLLGVAIGWLSGKTQAQWPFLIGIFILASAYTMIMLVSVIKDTYYRKGTEAALGIVLETLEKHCGPSETDDALEAPSKLLRGSGLHIYHPRVLRNIGLREPSGIIKLRTTYLIRVFYMLVLLILLALTGYSIWATLFPQSVTGVG